MTRIPRKVIAATAAALVLAAGASAATAAVISGGPVDTSGVIHGCWSNAKLNGSHVFVLQDAGTSCPRGTTAISWSKGTPGIDGGTVAFDGTGTCTVLRSSGPDAVTVTYDLPYPADRPGVRGCKISGFPAGSAVQATAMLYAAPGTSNNGTEAVLYPQGAASTDVVLAYSTAIGVSGEFSWIAVPSS